MQYAAPWQFASVPIHMETQPHPQGTPIQTKTSGLAIASFIMAFLPLLNCLGLILGIVALVQINDKTKGLKGSGLAIGGLVISVVIWPVIALLASMMLPALAKAKAKANRIKCVNNLKNINMAHMSFAQDNAERYPWQLSGPGMENHFGSNSDMAQTAGGVFGLAAMKSELMMPKILVSPCDPERMMDNEIIQMDWSSYDTKAGDPIPGNGISYVLCEGADTQRPSTILLTTRNLSTDDLATARWLGADRDLDFGDPNVMAGLRASQGQLTTADGASMQTTDADLGLTGRRTKSHINSRGGQTKGSASTRIFR